MGSIYIDFSNTMKIPLCDTEAFTALVFKSWYRALDTGKKT